jgi:hypothetical protein
MFLPQWSRFHVSLFLSWHGHMQVNISHVLCANIFHFGIDADRKRTFMRAKYEEIIE